MKNISIKALLMGTAVSILLAILFTVVRGMLRSYVNILMFGDAGGYSYEEHQAINSHSIVISYDLVSSLLKIAIPCAVAANITKTSEMLNSAAMSILLSIYAYILYLGMFKSMAHWMFILHMTVALLVSWLVALMVIKYKKTHNKSLNPDGAEDAPPG